MAALSDLTALVRARIAGVPEPMLDLAGRTAVRRFCELTRAVRRTVSITAIEGVRIYSPTLPPEDGDLEFLDPIAVQVDGVPLDPASPMEVPDTGDVPGYYIWYPRGLLELTETPEPGVSVLMTIAVNHSLSATAIAQDIMPRWANPLMNGALAYLHSMPEKSWSNAGLAELYEASFTAAANDAKAKSDRQYRTRRFRTRVEV